MHDVYRRGGLLPRPPPEVLPVLLGPLFGAGLLLMVILQVASRASLPEFECTARLDMEEGGLQTQICK